MEYTDKKVWLDGEQYIWRCLSGDTTFENEQVYCYSVTNIEWEHDGREDDMSRYPTEFEFMDNRSNGVGAVDPVGHILKSQQQIGRNLKGS